MTTAADAAVDPPSHVVRPPARRARILGVSFSVVAVVFSLGFGVYIRRTVALFDRDAPERYAEPLVMALVLLLVCMVFRMIAAICELLWLERTWSNLPEELRNVGPVAKVSSGLVVGLSFVPGLSWVWKLGLIIAVADGFERVRSVVPFRAPIPKKLGLAAVVVAWVPGLNVYLAPFLWEMFATRIDVVCTQIRALQASSLIPSPREEVEKGDHPREDSHRGDGSHEGG